MALQDTDLLLVNRGGVDYKAAFSEIKAGLGPSAINPAPGDFTFAPAIASGTGTQADPYIITPSTVSAPGGTAESAQTLKLTGLKENDIVSWTDNSAGAGTRFNQASSVVPAGGNVDLKLHYTDTPSTTTGQAYTGDLQIGTTYFRWVVTQQVSVAPVIDTVVLADSPEAGRFTSGTFQTTVTLTTEGVPPSTKGLKAWVEGTLKAQPVSDEITAFDAGTKTLTLKTDKDLLNFASGDAVKQNGPTAGAPPTTAFATTTYSGTGAAADITNGLDLAGEGGLVWIKRRNGTQNNALVDTVRGALLALASNENNAQVTNGLGVTAFKSDGFSLGNHAIYNATGGTYVAWTFRKGGGFFDVVTYTGTGAVQNIPHNLGSVPGFIIVKRTDSTGDWRCYHRTLTGTTYINLNETNASVTTSPVWNDTDPTSSVFTVGTNPNVNASGGTYVAYLFGSDDTNIKCGTYTGNGGAQSIITGFDTGWVLIKNATAGITNWVIVDSERDTTGGNSAQLFADLGNTEVASSEVVKVTATGFDLLSGNGSVNKSGDTLIYIAIKDGAVAPGGTPSGVVASTDATAKTMTLSSSSGTWGVNTGNWVIGPEKTVANTKLYTVHDAAGAVSDLQSADPGYVTMTGSSPYTLTFPATLPSGNPPDTDLPAGTTITTDVQATSTGSTPVNKNSNTVTPA